MCLPTVPLRRGSKGNAVPGDLPRWRSPEGRSCPRNCKRRISRQMPLGISVLGRRRKVTTREPGDLPSAVVTREDVGRGVLTSFHPRRVAASWRETSFAVTCHCRPAEVFDPCLRHSCLSVASVFLSSPLRACAPAPSRLVLSLPSSWPVRSPPKRSSRPHPICCLRSRWRRPNPDLNPSRSRSVRDLQLSMRQRMRGRSRLRLQHRRPRMPYLSPSVRPAS